MKIVADSHIPFLKGVFESVGADVLYLDNISSRDVCDADALIVRTRTRCDSALLSGSRVGFVATATIGFDHVDLKYLSENGIGFSSSTGCNARGVAQWVLSSLSAMHVAPGTLGIVGVGNVGTELQKMALIRGWKVLLNDPPRAAAENSLDFVDLDALIQGSDVVTLHVPLDDSTRGLACSDFFGKFSGQVFINSSRPQVVDDNALKDAIRRGKVGHVAIDVWNGEPDIDRELLSMVDIATQHIAGYSKRGKVRATEMAVRAIARHFGIQQLLQWNSDEEYKTEEPEDYDIMADDRALRNDPCAFEQLRNNYDYR